MALICVEPPTAEPVALADAKLHLRVDGDDEDALIAGLITAARAYVETICRPQLALMRQTWRLVLDAWPSTARIELRPYPLQGVLAVRYRPLGESEPVTLTPETYLVDTASEPGRLLARNGWPGGALEPMNGFEVEFVAGTEEPHETPAVIRQAMLLLVGHWYENREIQVTTGAVPAALAFTVTALLRPWRREV